MIKNQESLLLNYRNLFGQLEQVGLLIKSEDIQNQSNMQSDLLGSQGNPLLPI